MGRQLLPRKGLGMGFQIAAKESLTVSILERIVGSNWSWLSALLILNLLDILLTQEALSWGGKELNPLLLALGDNAMLYKLLVPSMIGAILMRFAPMFLRIVACSFAIIVLWNTIILMLG